MKLLENMIKNVGVFEPKISEGFHRQLHPVRAFRDN